MGVGISASIAGKVSAGNPIASQRDARRLGELQTLPTADNGRLSGN